MRSKAILLLFLLAPLAMLSQNTIKDTVYGNVKSVREKLIFLDSIRQNYKLFAEEDEYGHHGFTSRRATISRFNTFWYTLPFTHYMNYYREYNHKNQITTETWYYKDDSFLTKYEFAYDEKGNLVEEKESDEDGKIDLIKRYGYDYLNRRASQLRMYSTDIGLTFRVFRYDNDDNLVLEEAFGEEGKASASEHEYESKNRIRTYISFKKWIPSSQEDDGNYKWERIIGFEYKYDLQGNKVEDANYSSQREFPNARPEIIRYTYDEHNNLTAIINNNWDTNHLHEYVYDNDNRVISENHSSNGTTTLHADYMYKNNNLIKLIYTEDGKTITATYSYKFDSHNNWTEQTKSINGKPLYVRREIVYY